MEGHEDAYSVLDWNYHHGSNAEDTGLRVILEEQLRQQCAV
jgi:hypothetical protein